MKGIGRTFLFGVGQVSAYLYRGSSEAPGMADHVEGNHEGLGRMKAYRPSEAMAHLQGAR